MCLHLYMRPMGGWLLSPLRVYMHDVKKGQIKIIERKKNYFYVYVSLFINVRGTRLPSGYQASNYRLSPGCELQSHK